jgi:hypothetical protein
MSLHIVRTVSAIVVSASANGCDTRSTSGLGAYPRVEVIVMHVHQNPIVGFAP